MTVWKAYIFIYIIVRASYFVAHMTLKYAQMK